MKKQNIIFIFIVILFTGVGFFAGTLVNNKKENVCENTKKISKDDYYKKIASRMYDYYLVAFKSMKTSSKLKDQTVRLSLSTLEGMGFPMDEFVTYEGDEECDKNMSFALRKLVGDKYAIEIYYKCGRYANYTLPTTTTTQKQSTQTNKQ